MSFRAGWGKSSIHGIRTHTNAGTGGIERATRRIPGGENDASICGVCLQLLDHFSQLIKAFPTAVTEPWQSAFR